MLSNESIDLTKNDLYARAGFELSWVNQLPHGELISTSNQSNQWIKVEGNQSGGRSVVVNDLFYDHFKEGNLINKINDFTFVSSFQFDEEQLSNSNFKGLFLTTIGNHWAVYLNGKLIKNRINKNKNGSLVHHHFMRHVLLQLNQQDLKLGENIIAFRFVGLVSDLNMGFYNSEPYLIGDYDALKGKQAEISSVALSFTYLILGLFFIFIYFRRGKGIYNFVFGITCIALFIYLISRSIYIRDYIDDSLIILKFEFISLFIFSGLSVMFYDLILEYPVSRFARLYASTCALFAFLVLIGNVIFIDNILRLWQMTAITSLIYVLFYRVFLENYTTIKNVKEEYKDLGFMARIMGISKFLLFKTVAGNLMIGTILFTITAAFDIADSLQGGSGVIGFKYGFFIFMMGNAGVLINKFVKAQVQAEDLTVNLEKKVEGRTQSLGEANSKLELMNRVNQRMIKDIEHARDLAKQSNKAKGEFLATMSHEIRTPINGVIGMINMLKETKLNPKQKEYNDVASNSATSLLSLINDILDFSKMEAGKLELENKAFELRSVIENFNKLVAIEIENMGVVYFSSVDKSIPNFLIGDENRLRQILFNLVSNAKKFTSQGEISLAISLNKALNEAEHGGPCEGRIELLFSVKDTGIGIPKEYQNSLFDKFSQADKSTTRKYGGTGLGLAISKQLVEAMDGTIEIKSKLNHGSNFYFTASFELASDSQITSYKEKSNSETFDKKLNLEKLAKTRVLVAEDNKVNQIVITGVLKKYKIIPTIVNDGIEALEMLRTQPFDIVFMDLQMPKMDGLESTRHIRNGKAGIDNTNVTIVAVTANAMKGDLDQCLAAGMNDYLSKPILLEQMNKVVLKWLG